MKIRPVLLSNFRWESVTASLQFSCRCLCKYLIIPFLDNGGIIAGPVIGGIVLIAIVTTCVICALIYCWCKNKCCWRKTNKSKFTGPLNQAHHLYSLDIYRYVIVIVNNHPDSKGRAQLGEGWLYCTITGHDTKYQEVPNDYKWKLLT